MNTKKKITIKDVAEYAGVSIGAVSKVLHGSGASIRVSEAKAEVIRQAAAILQYKPNHHARSLRSGRTHLIGIAGTDRIDFAEHGLYNAYLLDRLMAEAFQKSYSLVLSQDILYNENFETTVTGRYDGMIWPQSVQIPQLWDVIEQSSLPNVVIQQSIPETQKAGLILSIDPAEICRLAFVHLKNLGHEKIGFFVSTQKEPKESERRTACATAFAVASELKLCLTPFHHPTGLAALDEWNTDSRVQTAFFALSDLEAGQLLSAASHLKISVPHDLSIIGSDSTPYATWSQPPLTSVKKPIERIAQTAIESLIDMIQSGDRTPRVVQFQPTLDVRETTAPPGRR